MTTEAYVDKGTRLRARWLQSRPVALSGMQMKVEAHEVCVTGVVRHIRSDHATELVNPTFFLDVEEGTGYEECVQHCAKCGHDHVEVKPGHVVEVL